MNLRRQLESRLGRALVEAGAAEGAAALVARGVRAEFGDYQANGAMPAARQLHTNPRKLAEKVAAAADLSDLAESVEVAGPGFINIRLRADWLGRQVARALQDERLGVDPPQRKQTIVVDYSHPNLAKEMHVGHLRSTIIGDALTRTLEFLGHDVVRQNHVGDWGTQFGMLLAYMDQLAGESDRGLSTELADLEEFYRQATERFSEDADFAETARRAVVRLQGGDEHYRAAWRRFIEESLRHCQRVYDRLGVTLTGGDVVGESAYNDDLPNVVEDLRKAGLLTESRGALCVFLDGFQGKDGKPLPAIVRKSDGGYLYATTDLAAVRYRANVLKADRILYVVDARQTLHLRQVFVIARKAGFAPESCSLEHHPFGMMLGSDGRPFKTREGGAVKLTDLLDEAEARAFDLVTEKNPDLDEPQRREIARVVGIGAVKYADLSQNRTSDYVFDWNRMLSLEGNTAPYMQYAYARVRSIFRKGAEKGTGVVFSDPQAGGAAGGENGSRGVLLGEPAERALGLRLAQFPETVDAVATEALPNLLCGYLFDLAGAFMAFYESCPVLQSQEPVRASRLTLCLLTARTIQTGLGLLGIETLEQM
jgi:arginyl-tRNA synthetase